ncbi:MAG: hypothetical protein AAGG46_02225, partial [Planctomycetota bacterium]
ESGVPRPLSPHYDAVAPLAVSANTAAASTAAEPPTAEITAADREAYDLLRVGLTGRAKIHVRDKTLGQRLYRYLARTFNFEL